MKNFIHALQNCILFQGFTEAEIGNIINPMSLDIKNFVKEEIIALEETPCTSVGIVLEGRAEIKKIYASGKVVTLTPLNEGDIFGEVIVFSDEKTYPATIIATEKSKIIFISRQNLLNLCTTHIDFLNNFLELLSQKILMLNQKVTNLSFQTIRQKLAGFILATSRKQNTLSITLNLSKKELAEQLGIPRPSLSRELIHMKHDGLIEYDKRTITILDRVALENSLFE